LAVRPLFLAAWSHLVRSRVLTDWRPRRRCRRRRPASAREFELASERASERKTGRHTVSVPAPVNSIWPFLSIISVKFWAHRQPTHPGCGCWWCVSSSCCRPDARLERCALFYARRPPRSRVHHPLTRCSTYISRQVRQRVCCIYGHQHRGQSSKRPETYVTVLMRLGNELELLAAAARGGSTAAISSYPVYPTGHGTRFATGYRGPHTGAIEPGYGAVTAWENCIYTKDNGHRACFDSRTPGGALGPYRSIRRCRRYDTRRETLGFDKRIRGMKCDGISLPPHEIT
jgi:hypothetical protein